MERIDGPLALSFLSENFLGHEAVSFTLDGKSGIHVSSAQILLMNAVERQDYAAGKGGHVILGIAAQNLDEIMGNVGFVSEFCIYHLDTYIPETIDVDAIIEQQRMKEFNELYDALDAWTTYDDDEPESPDYGGDE